MWLFYQTQEAVLNMTILKQYKFCYICLKLKYRRSKSHCHWHWSSQLRCGMKSWREVLRPLATKTTASRCSWQRLALGPSSWRCWCSPPCGARTRPGAAPPGWAPQACRRCVAEDLEVCRCCPGESWRRVAGRRPGQPGSRLSACWPPCSPPPPPACFRWPCRTLRCNASTRWSASPWQVRPPRCKEPFPPGQRKENSTPGSIQSDLYHLAKCPPPFAERPGDLRVVHLGGRLDDLVTLDLAPNSEWKASLKYFSWATITSWKMHIAQVGAINMASSPATHCPHILSEWNLFRDFGSTNHCPLCHGSLCSGCCRLLQQWWLKSFLCLHRHKSYCSMLLP